MVALLESRSFKSPARIRSRIARGRVRYFREQAPTNLLPLDITVRKFEATAPPDDGLVVKTGDKIVISASPNASGNSSVLDGHIKWSKRQLKADGNYTEWGEFGEQMNEFEYTVDTGGVFQLKALVYDQQEVMFVRKKDALHATGSDGIYNEELRKGKPDFIGVVDSASQIALRNTAKSFLGSTAYEKVSHIDIYDGGPKTDGSDKCNIFVYHCAKSSGTPIPLSYSYYSATKLAWVNMPPRAHQWGDPDETITSWSYLGYTLPQPGYVVVKKGAGRSSHMGILNYDGTWINAGANTVNQSIHLSTHPKYQPARFRKYTP